MTLHKLTYNGIYVYNNKNVLIFIRNLVGHIIASGVGTDLSWGLQTQISPD